MHRKIILFYILSVFLLNFVEGANYKPPQPILKAVKPLSYRKKSKPCLTIPEKPVLPCVIVLDAGHGGKDLGTHSFTNPKYQEKQLTLTTTRMVKNFLEQCGHTVKMTRNSDRFISLEQRTEMANKTQPKVFVSIHFNSAPNKDANGIEIYYYRDESNKKRMASSKALANAILKKTLFTTEAASRGVRTGDLRMVRETTMTAVLIEGGFLTNEEERKKIKNAAYLKKLAWGITLGIQDYLRSNG